MSSVDPLSSFHLSALLNTYQARVENVLRDLRDQRILTRLWNRDHTIWKPEPTEIHNRLGWLQGVDSMRGELARIPPICPRRTRRRLYPCAPAGHGRLQPRASRVCSPRNSREAPAFMPGRDRLWPRGLNAQAANIFLGHSGALNGSPFNMC